MLEKGKVSSRQGILLLTFTVVVSTAVLIVPAITAATAGRDGWISILVVATVYGLLVAMAIFTLSIVAVFVLALQESNFSNLLPVMEDGIKPVLRGGLAPMAWRGEIIFVSMLLPYIGDLDNAGKYLAYSTIFIGFILTLVTLSTTAVIGELTKYLTFPFFELARCITIGRFIERMEALILVMWVAGVTIKVATFFYVAALGTGQLFGLSDYRPTVLPIGLLLAVWSLELFENSSQVITWLSEVLPPYAFVIELGIPLFLLVVAIIAKKGGKYSRG